MSDDPEREYVEAKAAYHAALVRLAAAKKARPKKPTNNELRAAENQRIEVAVWQSYVDGERDYQKLADEYGRSEGWIRYHIKRLKRERNFGPETLLEHKMRVWFEGTDERYRAEHEARLAMARAVPIELLGHSEAWHQAYQAFEEQRRAAEKSGG